MNQAACSVWPDCSSQVSSCASSASLGILDGDITYLQSLLRAFRVLAMRCMREAICLPLSCALAINVCAAWAVSRRAGLLDGVKHR